MFKDEYGQAAVEVLDILDNTKSEDVGKIPTSFIKFLVDNADENYVVNFDHSKPMNELNMSEKARELLGYIYINWWCSKEERKVYDKQIKQLRIQKQEEQRKMYNPNNIFENKRNERTSESIKTENTKMIKYEDNVFKRFIDKIISFFKKDN